MKKNIVLLAALSLGAISAAADDAATAAAPVVTAPEASSFSMNSAMGYESQYLFHSVQYAEGIITPSVNAFYGNWYAGTWFAIPIQDESYWSDEMDLYVGYNLKISDLVTADIGIMHYSYDNCVSDFLNPDNSTEGYVGFLFNTFLKPNIYFHRDFDCLTTSIELKISYSIPLGKVLSLDLGANGGRTWGQEGFTDYSFWGTKADFTYTIKPGSTVSVGARYNGSTERYFIGSIKDPSAQYNAFWYGIQFCTNF
jgi:uncharacterized protein (TIGR02001 family)